MTKLGTGILVLSWFSVLFLIGAGGVFALDPDSAVDCYPNKGECEKNAEGITITFDISPKPVREMKDLVFTVRLTKDGNPVTDAGVSLDLTMPGMRMARNRPFLNHTGGGLYEGRVVIVRCPTSEKVWRAEVIINRYGRVVTSSFVFSVQ